MRSNFDILFAVGLAGLSSAAWCADATVGALSKIQGETILIKARVAREAAQAELNMKLRDGGAIADAGADDLPVVRSVYGARTTLVANLLFSNGTTREVRVGDEIRGGYRVTRISVERVDLSKGSGKTAKSYTLGFSSTPPLASSSTSLPGAPPSPPTPPGVVGYR